MTKVVPIAALSQWNRWSTGSTDVPSLNTGGIRCQHHLATLRQKRESRPWKSFSTMRCLFDKPLCKTLKQFRCIWSFLTTGLPWIISWQLNDLASRTWKRPWTWPITTLWTNSIRLEGGGQRPYCDPEQLSCHMEEHAANEHYFQISTRSAPLVHPGWLYFWVLSCNWIFNSCPKQTIMKSSSHLCEFTLPKEHIYD